MTDLTKTSAYVALNLDVGDILWLVGCLGFEPRLALSQTGIMRLLSGAYVKPPRLREASAGSAPTLHYIPWYLL